MRLILRVVGTWLLGMALILLIIDGTRSLAASAVIMTPLGDTWAQVEVRSLDAVRAFLGSRFLGSLLQPGFEALLQLPGFLVLAVPGLLLGIMGRSRRSRMLVRQDML